MGRSHEELDSHVVLAVLYASNSTSNSYALVIHTFHEAVVQSHMAVPVSGMKPARGDAEEVDIEYADEAPGQQWVLLLKMVLGQRVDYSTLQEFVW